MLNETIQLCCLCLIITCVTLVLCVDDEPIWYSYQFGTGHGDREELVITDVESDNSFNLGKDVLRWKSISLGSMSYAVGLLPHGFVIVTAKLSSNKKKFVVKSQKVTELDSPPTDLELFSHWNEDLLKQEIVLAIALGESSRKLLFYTIKKDNWERLWAWHIDTRLSRLQYFKLEDNKHRLLLIRDDLNDFNAYLYEFTLEHSSKRNYWLTQTFPLSVPAFSSAINTYGSDAYLSIPQRDLNTVFVYKLVDNRFQLYQNITSENVSHIHSFKIGFKSFLAIGGGGAGIYRFTQRGMVWEEIDGLNLDFVDFWFPVPIKTYRDEVILVLQRTLPHETHKSFFLEVVLYNGRKFVPHEEITCSFYGEVEHGLACMVDEEGERGLLGAAVVSLKNTLGILVPRNKTSGLFMMHTTMKQLESPVEIEVKKLKETREKLQQMIDEQQSRIKTIQGRLENAIKRNETNVVTAAWKINTLSAPIVQQKLEDVIPAQALTVEEIDIQDLKDDLAKIRHTIDNIKRNMLNAVWLNKQEHNFEELTVDGEVRALRESHFNNVIVKKFNDEPVAEAFNDLVRKGNMQPIRSHKTFTDLEIENLNFEILNGVDIHNRIGSPTTPLILSNDVVFENPVKVIGEVVIRGQVNDHDLSTEIVEMNKRYEEPLIFEEVEVDVAQINNLPAAININAGRGDTSPVDLDQLEIDEFKFPGSITVENVNGEHFDEFIKSLCFTNIETHIPGDTVIAGEINLEQTAEIDTLNGLKFPEEYVLENSEFSVISGKKMFDGPIFVDVVTTDGVVNGMETEKIVTLTKNQSLTGTFTFSELEVTESLNVEGEITGQFVNNFLTNAILPETHEVKAKVNFKSLVVEGNVIVSDSFNKADFGEILNDVLYKDEEIVTISAIKNFPAGFTVHNGMHIDSKAIDTIPISSFITKNTEQTIFLQTLNGPVSFENLILNGLYGDIDITKLEQETVKLTGEQFISSTLIFTNDNEDETDLSATDLTITATLNNLTARDYFFTTGDSRSLNNVLDFEAIRAENIFVEGDVSGDLLDFSLQDFDERRLSYTRDQVVTATYNVKNLECENLRANFINGEPFEKFFNFQYYAEKIAEMLFEGKLKIKNLYVNGSVFVESVNEQDVKQFFKNCVWTDRNNNFDSVIFQKNVVINNFNLKNFNNVDFTLFTNNIIFNTEENLVIDSFKFFINGFRVTKMLNSERLNDVHVDDILTKTGTQELVGPLNIHGNVLINSDCEVHENFNDVSAEYVAKTYQFVDDTCVINEDVMMGRLAYIEKLDIEGYANNENLEEFLSNIVYKSENTKLSGKITFEDLVAVKQNIIVENTLNDYDFDGFVEEMVVITRDDVIDASVTFIQPVYIEDELIVDSDLSTRYLRGIQLDSWNKRAVFINQGQIEKNLEFEFVTVHENMYLNYLNDIDLNNLIPLRTDQYINQTLKFYEVIPYNDVRVGNLVNGVKLQEEYRKTLFDTGDIQTITQSMKFYGNLLVGKNIEINNLVNGRNLSKLVTTDTDQTLTASYNFTENANLDSDLIISESINDINPLEWKNRSVRSYADYPQEIYDSWKIDGNTTFNSDVDGEGLIGGFNAHKLAQDVVEKRMLKTAMEIGLVKNYANMCTDVNMMIERAQNQINLFKYLEMLQFLEFKNNIEYVHPFKHKNQNYILITEVGSCISYLLIWSKSQFQRIREIETGSISQFISVYDGDLLFFVSKHDDLLLADCSVQGTNVWKFDSDDLMQLYKIEDQQLLQESLVPGKFYGLSENYVVEFIITTIVETNVKRYRKWKVDAENLVFVPRGLGTGLALTDGQKIFRLIQEDPVIEDDFGYETDAYIIGKVVEESNTLLPGRYGNDVLIINVGVEGNRRTLVAIASHEETSVKGRLDFIKIYEDIFTGKLFHKVPSYNPSSLISLEFGNSGETLLIFLEDRKTLQVYEYKGIEGFKHRTSAKWEGSKLISIPLPMEPNEVEKMVIGVINNNRIGFIQAVMTGNQVNVGKQLCVL